MRWCCLRVMLVSSWCVCYYLAIEVFVCHKVPPFNVTPPVDMYIYTHTHFCLARPSLLLDIFTVAISSRELYYLTVLISCQNVDAGPISTDDIQKPASPFTKIFVLLLYIKSPLGKLMEQLSLSNPRALQSLRVYCPLLFCYADSVGLVSTKPLHCSPSACSEVTADNFHIHFHCFGFFDHCLSWCSFVVKRHHAMTT